MEIELKINIGNDRESMVIALANAGFPVCIKEKKKDFRISDYYVCFTIKD